MFRSTNIFIFVRIIYLNHTVARSVNILFLSGFLVGNRRRSFPDLKYTQISAKKKSHFIKCSQKDAQVANAGAKSPGVLTIMSYGPSEILKDGRPS